MDILIETHLHNSEASPCAVMPARDIPALYLKAGYQGIVVTNHFSEYCLNTLLKRSTPFESVKAFFSNSRLAADAASSHGLKSFVGAEVTLAQYGWQDYLLYGELEEGFCDHPLLYLYTHEQLFELAHKYGWAVFQAHPFRAGCSVGDPQYMHGIEFFNGHNNGEDSDDRAQKFVNKFGLKSIAGGDFHNRGAEGKAGIFIPDDINTEGDLSACLINYQAKLFINRKKNG